MHNLILGKRNSAAQTRILHSSALLADYFEIDPLLVSALKVQEKDAVIKAMKQREAIANLLDAIAIELKLIDPNAPAEDPTEEGEGLPAVPSGDPIEGANVTQVDGDLDPVTGETVPSADGVPGDTGEGLPQPILDDQANAPASDSTDTVS